ncbi:unnamed protein product [Danaus chrysippus]|uniref:(African queen) hypothetical protein n=1 Tax=Danaus chrysippus TaxID=151541 RepID=A0A8J2R3F8_9NEOP|nr:unnamed protein product [Danaus chrysippus]
MYSRAVRCMPVRPNSPAVRDRLSRVPSLGLHGSPSKPPSHSDGRSRRVRVRTLARGYSRSTLLGSMIETTLHTPDLCRAGVNGTVYEENVKGMVNLLRRYSTLGGVENQLENEPSRGFVTWSKD